MEKDSGFSGSDSLTSHTSLRRNEGFKLRYML